MQTRSSRAFWRAILCSSMTLSIGSVSAASPEHEIPTLPSRIPTTRPLGLRPNSSRQSLPLRNVSANQQAEVRPQEDTKANPPAQHQPGPTGKTEIPPHSGTSPTGAAAEGCGPCGGAPCIPYLRNRPDAHCNQGDRIKMYNRMYEPNWYKYYRCCHYGYHPTQWAAWPDGWLTCRHPQPGPHPYDYQPPKPDQKELDRERRIQESERRPDREAPGELPDPLLPGPIEGPRPLAPPQNTTPNTEGLLPPGNPPELLPMN